MEVCSPDIYSIGKNKRKEKKSMYLMGIEVNQTKKRLEFECLWWFE